MSGRVTLVEKWYTSGEPQYSVYIWTSFEGAEFEEEIALSSIYQVDKVNVGVDKGSGESYTPCHYCGMPAKGIGPLGEPACEECGG